MAPMLVPTAPLETRRCYGCNASFEVRADVSDRLCERCRAGRTEASSAPAVTGSDPEQSAVLSAFLMGLITVPIGGVCIWLLRAVWQVSPGLVVSGFIGLTVLGSLARPFVRKKRGPIAVEVAGYAGVFLSLVLVALLSRLLE